MKIIPLNAPVTDARFAVGLREEGLKARYLRICQPEKIKHVHCWLFDPWITSLSGNQWVLTLAVLTLATGSKTPLRSSH